MKNKEKAIDICNNLTHTINTMSDKETVQSASTAFFNCKIRKSELIKQRKNLMKKYKLTPKDIKDYGITKRKG